MTVTPTTTFRIRPVTASALAAARAGDPDRHGSPVVRLTASGSEPLRCCLRDARPGEACLLFNYEPELPDGTPYQERGAVFAHAERCDGPASETAYPSDWVGRPQVLRAYDKRGWIHPASGVHDGTDPVAALQAVLSDPAVAQVHSRNIAYGCYMFTVSR